MQTDTKIPVVLAGRDFVLKQVPMARVKRLSTTLAQVFAGADAADVATEAGVTTLVDKLMQAPHAVLSLFIDNLPAEIFEDEENGVTLPEFLDVLQKAVTLNRVDVLKNVFSRLTPTLIQAQAQASMSTKTS